MSHYGVDVSSNNAHPLNIDAIKAELERLGGGGQPFAIVKVNQGTGYVNPYAVSDIMAFKAAGFAVGGYLMDEGTADPGGEEGTYNNVVSGVPQFDDDELPDGLSEAAYIQHLKGLIAQHPAIQYLNQSEAAEGYDQSIGLWLAEYNGQPGNVAFPSIIHQYASDGVIPGAAGVFDMNIFCGSEAQFEAVFAVPAPTIQGSVFMIPTGCTDSGAVQAQMRFWWATIRSDPMPPGAPPFFDYFWKLPKDQTAWGKPGWGGDPDTALAWVIDDASSTGHLRPNYAGAV
jgi:hypothetical protein